MDNSGRLDDGVEKHQLATAPVNLCSAYAASEDPDQPAQKNASRPQSSAVVYKSRIRECVLTSRTNNTLCI